MEQCLQKPTNRRNQNSYWTLSFISFLSFKSLQKMIKTWKKKQRQKEKGKSCAQTCGDLGSLASRIPARLGQLDALFGQFVIYFSLSSNERQNWKENLILKKYICWNLFHLQIHSFLDWFGIQIERADIL